MHDGLMDQYSMGAWSTHLPRLLRRRLAVEREGLHRSHSSHGSAYRYNDHISVSPCVFGCTCVHLGTFV